ncbi:MAG TPA: phage holin family protein, partial [Gemmataceae bacterium]|nr:phage holin family protein [Gemmataceae bacterium]
RSILSDVQELLRQQLALFKAEVRESARETREAALSLVAGVGMSFFGILLLLFALAHLLNWASGLPAWASFAIVGGLVLAIGLAMVKWGKERFSSIHPLPEQTAASLRENVQWLTNRK